MGFVLSTELEDYVEQHTTAVDELLRRLDRETHVNFTLPQMLSGHVQGKVLEMLSHMIRPDRILEIGTYTGYSAICLAKGLNTGGRLFTMDINVELEETVRKFFDEAGLSDVIDFRIGSGLDIIPELDEVFDLVFIDADKENYSNYFDLVFPKLRMGGYIIADNVLWSGRVLEERGDEETLALQAYSDKVHKDVRVENVLLSVRDGLLIARKVAE